MFLDISLFDDGHLQGEDHEEIFKAIYGLTLERAREIRECLDPFSLSSADYFCVEESGDGDCAALLNRNAKLESDTSKVLDSKLHTKWKDAFKTFVERLESSGDLLPGDLESITPIP